MICSVAHETGLLGGVDATLGRLHGLPAWLQTHYAHWQRNKYRRVVNRLANAQVTREALP